MKRISVGGIILIVVAFLIYSSSILLSKCASQCDFFSIPYIVLFCGVVLSLGIYAILWQKILSFMPLNKAFLCKSMTIFFVLSFSYYFFNEQITLFNVIGVIFIFCGLLVLSWER